MAILIRGMDMPGPGEFKHIRIYDNGEVTVEFGNHEEAVIAHAEAAADAIEELSKQLKKREDMLRDEWDVTCDPEYRESHFQKDEWGE